MTAITMLATAGLSIFAAPPATTQPVALQVPGALQTAPPGTVRIDGWLGERIDANIKGRLTHVPMDELLAGFRNRPGKQNWIGEHIGKWMHAACLAYRYSGDTTLRAMLDKAVPELLATQLPDGYLGTYDDTKRWKSWDVWVHKYDLIGLLAYHQLTGDAASLTACRRIADMLISGFGPGKRDIVKSGEHMGMAATSVLEPMVKLYVITGNQRYLAFCRYIVDSWEQPHGPKVLSSLLDQGKVARTANAKAYEMMSDLVGLCELHRVVGDERYLQAARNAWEDIHANQMYITGGVSFKEHFQSDGQLTDAGNVAETCANVTWMQLCIQLLTITGESKYAEPIERVIYNHLTAAQAADGEDWCYFTPLRGNKPFHKNISCCHSSGPRGVAMIPTVAYLTGDKLLYVNLITKSRFKGNVPGVGPVELQQNTNYPTNGKVTITLLLENPAHFTLKLRIPSREIAEIRLNGEPLPVQPRELLLAQSYKRQWQPSDKIELLLDTPPRWKKGQGGDSTKVALSYGPFVLCASTRWNPDLLSPESIAVDPDAAVTPSISNNSHDVVLARASVPTPPGSPPRQVVLGPYAMVQHEPFAVWMPTKQQPADVRFGPLPNTNTVFTPAIYDYKDWRKRRDWLRDQVKLAAGMFPDLPRGPLNARVFGKLVRDGYTIEKVYFESSPGIYVTGNLYRPLHPAGKCPVVACPHGHWKNGRLEHTDVCSVPARCITLARNGAIVFAYDMVGYNDNALAFKHGEAPLDTDATAMWGIGHFQLQSFNSSRVIDFLLSLPDADPTRVGATGASGGGTQTFTLAAVDDRVTVTAPVNMISSTMQGGCICENSPALRIDTNNMEIGALFAPKPMLMVSNTGDWTKLTPAVEFPFIHGIYDLYKADDHVVNAHFEGQHNYNLASREAMYHFFGRHLLGRSDANNIQEGKITVEKPEDMLVFNNPADIPAKSPSPQEIIELKKTEIRKSLTPYQPTSKAKFDELRTMAATALERVTGTNSENAHGYRMLLSQEVHSGPYLKYDGWIDCGGRVVRLVVLTHPTKPDSAYTICVDPDGLAAMDKHPVLIAGLVAAGQRVVFIEPFTTGSNRRPVPATQANKRPSGFFPTFNRTDAAEAAHDVFVALMVAIENGFNRQGVPVMDSTAQTNLIGYGRMGPVCLMARAMLPESAVNKGQLRLVADMNAFDADSDAAYLDQLFVPYIRRIGGLPTIAAACANGAMLLHNTAGKLDTTWLNQAAAVTKAKLRVDSTPADTNAIVSWIGNHE